MGQTTEVQTIPVSTFTPKPTLKTSQPPIQCVRGTPSFGTRRTKCAANHPNPDITNKVNLTSTFPISLYDVLMEMLHFSHYELQSKGILVPVHAMKACWVVQLQIQTLLTSALNRGEWSTPHSGRFIPGWVGIRAEMDAYEKKLSLSLVESRTKQVLVGSF
jgi:hypothetical protein